MIYSVNGKIENIMPFDGYYEVVVECLGVGYSIKTSDYSVAKLNSKGSACKFYTYLYIRENLIELYGFVHLDELDWFKLLISVSGVGPKAALFLLSGISYDTLAYSVSEGDFKKITTVKGIGAKTAQRIVMELKDKVKKFSVESTNAYFPEGNSSDFNQAFEALRTLGYSDIEIKSALKDVDGDSKLEDIIKISLKKLAK